MDTGGYDQAHNYALPNNNSLDNGATGLAVFEGSFDFFSHLSIRQNPPRQSNFLALNNASLLAKGRQLMEQYKRIDLYLDRDETGRVCTEKAMTWSEQYQDAGAIFNGFRDYTEWLQRVGRSQRRGFSM